MAGRGLLEMAADVDTLSTVWYTVPSEREAAVLTFFVISITLEIMFCVSLVVMTRELNGE